MLAISLASLASYYVPANGPRCAMPNRGVRAAALARSSPIVASHLLFTDGTDSFYGSRNLVQMLHDHGDFSKVTAFSASNADAKKMLISRNARYSGLIDILEFAEGGDGELASAFSGVNTWVIANGNEAGLLAQVAAAGKAGVKRIFVHLCAADSPADTSALKEALESSGAAYTVMRTGTLAKTGAGGGLFIEEVDVPTCDNLPIDDAFRFIVESLTIPEAEGRLFALRTSLDDSQLKQMRMAGCSRKEEAEALYKGIIKESFTTPEERAASDVAAKDAAAKEVDPRTDEEKAADSAEEIKKLLARAKETGIANQIKRKAEEVEKAAARLERTKLYSSQDDQTKDDEKKGDADDKDGKDDKDDGDTKPKGDSDTPDGKGGDDKPKKGGGDDDDGLQPA